MGIQGLGPFLKKFASRAIKEVRVSDYQGCKVAFDVSIFVNTFYYRNKAQDPKNIVKEFKRLVNTALDEDVYPIFVMEGRKLKLKANEHKKRQAGRERKEELLGECRTRKTNMEREAEERGYALDRRRHLSTGVVIPTSTAREGGNMGTSGSMSPEEKKFRKKYLDVCEEMDKREQTVGRPGEDHFAAVLEYLKGEEVGIDYAEDEAERHCSLLCIQGKVDAVATQDYDTIPFGAERVVMHWDTSIMKEIRLSVILEELEWNMEQLVDFCILCGCDFSGKVPMVGPKKAYDLVCKHGCIENMWNRLKPQFYRHEGSEEAFRYQLARLVFNHKVEEAEETIASPVKITPVKRRKVEKFKEVELSFPED